VEAPRRIGGVTVTEDAIGKLLVPDELWALVEPILPKHPPSPKGGKPRKPDRVCLTGILFVLKTGIPWEDFPHEMGCCGMTVWNRLDEWREAGVWDALHRLLLDELRGADHIDFDRVVVDSSSVRAVHGGKKRAPAPSTAARPGASTTWRSTRTASRWPPSSPRPTATT
jgi:transposase